MDAERISYAKNLHYLKSEISLMRHDLIVEIDDGSLIMKEGGHKIKITTGLGSIVVDISESEFKNLNNLVKTSVIPKVAIAIQRI